MEIVQMTAQQHAAENDQIRAALPYSKPQNRFILTQSVAGLDPEDGAALIKEVKNFKTFTEANDPYGEHDFGSIMFKGIKYFWKIDFYNGQEGIHKVLTLMEASDY
jgi:hypothetical protein